MPEGDLVVFSKAQQEVLSDLFRTFARSMGSADLSVSWTPGGGLSITRVGRDRRSLRPRQQDALVRLTEADGTNAWQYKAEEVIGADPLADPPTYAVKSPGRTWGINSEDEGLLIHPLKIEGLETVSSGADPVYVVRRIVVGGNKPNWVIVGAAGDSLPEPGSLYMVLQLQGDPDLVPVWDYVRAHE